MIITLDFASQEETMHHVVASYLKEALKAEELNHDHLSEIAQSVLNHLKEMHPASKTWKHKALNLEEKELVHVAIHHLVMSVKSPWKPTISPHDLSDTQNLILEIIRGNLPSIKKIIKADYVSTIVWKRNPQILQEARGLIQQLFIDMVQQLNQQELSSKEAFHMEVIIGDLLSLYPFLDPQQGEALNVPMQKDGKWQLMDYKVDRLSLTPKWMGSPLVALGLIPQQFETAPPLLLFKGTTYPTDEGFGLSLITDINPFASVGKYGFKLGKKKIANWLKRHTIHAKAQIYGKSLGGALAWQTALNFPNKIERVMAFGAPGFSSSDLKNCQELEKTQQLPLIQMFCQKNDPVPSVDYMATSGIHYYQVLGKNSHGGIAAHAHMYSTQEASAIIRLDPSREARRWAHFGLTIARLIASITLFPLLISLHSTVVFIDQTKRLLKKQWKIIVLGKNKKGREESHIQSGILISQE